MGIVVITIPGTAKRAFAQALYERTGGGVDLVIVQKPKNRTPLLRFTRFYRSVGWRNLLPEIWYAILLRLNRRAEHSLSLVREHTPPRNFNTQNPPKVLEVDSVNSSEVQKALKTLAPDLLVIWGSAVISPDILRLAKVAINLHMGVCPKYRGAVANHFALLRGDLENIGATIHYVVEKVDAGNILLGIRADTRKPPRELFRELNDSAYAFYLDIAHKLYRGERLPETPQNIANGENFKLSQWTPRRRLQAARKIQKWEQSFDR
ncbi:MAG: formyltransferase family protein [bacterium]|nr:formyltransferase family protein [bacterium]